MPVARCMKRMQIAMRTLDNIGHSDDPSFAMAFLYYVPLGISFSIMWPLKDLEYGGLFFFTLSTLTESLKI